jgi:5-methylcytosine-specific restriction endonuclease McrA
MEPVDAITHANIALGYWLHRCRHMNYHKEYLFTDHWRYTSRKKIEQVPYCERCGRTWGLDAHHLHYHTLGMERMQDLIVLCRPCHEKEHANA